MISGPKNFIMTLQISGPRKLHYDQENLYAMKAFTAYASRWYLLFILPDSLAIPGEFIMDKIGHICHQYKSSNNCWDQTNSWSDGKLNKKILI